MRQKGFSVGIILLFGGILLLVVTGVYILFAKKAMLTSSPSLNTEQEQNIISPSPSSVSWKIYKNDKWGYSFEIPTDWGDHRLSDTVQVQNGYSILHKNYLQPINPYSKDKNGIVYMGDVISISVYDEDFVTNFSREMAFLKNVHTTIEKVTIPGADTATKVMVGTPGYPILFVGKGKHTYLVWGAGRQFMDVSLHIVSTFSLE